MPVPPPTAPGGGDGGGDGGRDGGGDGGGAGAGGYLPPAAVAADAAELAEAVDVVMRRARQTSSPPPAGAAPRGGCWLLPSVQLGLELG